jgi:hypothetical protein
MCCRAAVEGGFKLACYMRLPEFVPALSTASDFDCWLHPVGWLLLQVRPLRGPCGEYGAHGTVDIEQDASRVYDFMRQVPPPASLPAVAVTGWPAQVHLMPCSLHVVQYAL